MAWLDTHPPRIQQFRCPRDERPSGIIGVHTAESFPDESPPDTGAENVARFIARRTSYGSYHWIADSDSRIQLIRHECVAYHIGTHGLNEHTVGISAATQAHKWDDLGDRWVDATVRNMARCAADAARWLQREHGVTVPARRITLAQALDRQPGFLAHADADPDRRLDPGATFPWDDFLDYYAAEMGDAVSYEQVWRTDGKMRAPKDLATDKNPRWWAESVLEHVADEVCARRFRSPFLRDEVRDGKEASNRWLQEWAWHYAHGARDAAGEARELARANAAKLDALMDAHEGVDLSGIKAHIDERFAAAAAERAEILALVEAVASGEREAADVVDEIGRRLTGGGDTDD